MSLCLSLVAAMSVAACSSNANAPTGSRLAPSDTLVVRDVVPASGATNVNPNAPITVTFNYGMMTGMEMLVVLHEGAVTGPAVAGTATWSADHKTLTFTPAAALKPKTAYVLHLSPNLVDAKGDTIKFAACAGALNGQAVPASMMSGAGGMMGSGTGMMGGANGMMGSGWQPGTGTWGYGMTLTFTTA